MEERNDRQIEAEEVARLLDSDPSSLLVLDSRPYPEYKKSHIRDAVSVNCSKLVKRRLQEDKVSW